jgi:hypothetical protein
LQHRHELEVNRMNSIAYTAGAIARDFKLSLGWTILALGACSLLHQLGQLV